MNKENKESVPFYNRFNFKISMLGLISSLIGLFMTVAVSYYGINALSLDSSKEIKEGLSDVSKEYTENYLNMTDEMLETKIKNFLSEQAVIGDSYQRYIDTIGEKDEIVNTISKLPSIKDNLQFNGRWYQNSENEQSVVLVPRYLLDENNNIKPNVKDQINRSSILDLLMPSAYKYGAKKLWIYYEGGKDESFMRIAPWNDAGTAMDKVYPAFTDKEMWEDFNPGLVDGWEKRIKEDKGKNVDLSSYAIVKSPTQDGGTGKIIMTLDYPLWDKQRNKFMGAIGVDVELDEIIKYIENVKLAKSGFAFISQSNGNVFAVNENGLRLLGLKNEKDATIKNDNGTGYNKMLRFFSESTFESVKNIKLPTNDKVLQGEISVDGKDYIIVQKNLNPLNTWSKEKGFGEETWTLGFLIPKDEVYSSYFASQSKIDKSKGRVLAIQFVIAVFTICLISIVIYFISRRITKNLRKLELAAKNIMNKDYDTSIVVDSNDEFGSLAKTMNNMTSEIKSSFEQLNIQNQLLKIEISEKENREKRIKYLEAYDALTNLPNQKLLNQMINDKVNNYETLNNIAVTVIGIDNFRNINEVFGSAVGDEVLKALANRLKLLLEGAGIVSRINGDEFAVVFYDTESVEEIAQKVESIINGVKQVFEINEKKLYISACIGVSSYPADTRDISDLIRLSSSALVHAKEKGYANYQFYSSTMDENAAKRITMITELRNAIKNNELELYYQPQVNMIDKKYVGVEALIRWNSKKLGRVMPNIFIPLAEETGLIFEIGDWVLKTACTQGKKWYDAGNINLRIGVNLSPIQFKNNKLIDSIKAIISETQFPADMLEIEVTEGMFIDNTKDVVLKLNELRSLGIKIAVDDFGTGYSSLSYIRELPIDRIKIDRSFIKEIPQNDNGTIAEIIINLSRSLNIEVIAEGVETSEQEKFLIERSCLNAQGYYYSVPLTSEELTKKLQ